MNIKKIEYGSPEYLKTLALRDRVLRIPLGLKLTPQETARDAQDFLFAAFFENKVFGCFIFTVQDSQTLKMRQVAVDASMQKQKVGATMMHFAEKWAREQNYLEIVLNARESISGFYTRLGYAKMGEIFVEVGIPHIKMKKRLV